jgi:hypothetical protein
MTTRIRAIAAVTAIAAFLASPAAALDGEILITQAKVNAGGITPGDASGFPATLSRPGRYKLSGNLVVPANQNGIDVTADDVVIDFNGFTVAGSPPGQARSGVIAGGDGLRVANGTIVGFLTAGIRSLGENSVVEDMRIVSTGVGVTASAGRVRNSTIVDSFTGIDCDGCLIEQNVVTGSTQDGMALTGGTALGNVIVGNGRFGITNSVGSARTGYGGNILFGNASGSVPGGSAPVQLHPNACEPACP